MGMAGVLTHSARVECFTNLNPMTAQRCPTAMKVHDVLVLVSFNNCVSLPAGVCTKSLQPLHEGIHGVVCICVLWVHAAEKRISRTKFGLRPIFTL